MASAAAGSAHAAATDPATPIVPRVPMRKVLGRVRPPTGGESVGEGPGSANRIIGHLARGGGAVTSGRGRGGIARCVILDKGG